MVDTTDFFVTDAEKWHISMKSIAFSSIKYMVSIDRLKFSFSKTINIKES